MPSHVISSIVLAWQMAIAAGRPFELRSGVPDNRIAFVRNRRVRVTVDADEERVVVILEHISGRHASWIDGLTTLAVDCQPSRAMTACGP